MPSESSYSATPRELAHSEVGSRYDCQVTSLTNFPSAMSGRESSFDMPNTLRTYIVEDNATIRENLIGTLEELTCVNAIGHSDGEASARAWLTANAPEWDLAIVDLFLKQGSGLGVLQGCAQRQTTQKVIVLTNYATPDIRKRCAQLGADAVFDKSNEIDALVEYCSQLSSANDAQAGPH